MTDTAASPTPPRLKRPDWVHVRAALVDLLAIGQYLQPTQLKHHFPLVEYVHPDQLARYKEDGMKLGSKYIASGVLVRSSTKAWEAALV